MPVIWQAPLAPNAWVAAILFDNEHQMCGGRQGEFRLPSISDKLAILPKKEIDACLKVASRSDLRGTISVVSFGIREKYSSSLFDSKRALVHHQNDQN